MNCLFELFFCVVHFGIVVSIKICDYCLGLEEILLGAIFVSNKIEYPFDHLRQKQIQQSKLLFIGKKIMKWAMNFRLEGMLLLDLENLISLL